MKTSRRLGGWWSTWPIRRRVVAASAVGLSLLFALSITTFRVTLDSVLTRAAQTAARTQAAQLAAVIRAGEYTAEGAVTQLPAQGSVVQARDTTGRILASSDPTASRLPITTATPAVGSAVEARVDHVAGEAEPYVVVTRTVTAPSRGPIVISVAVPLDVETRTLTSATVLLSVGAVVVAGVILVVLSRVVGAALRPVATITGEVGAITAAHATDRVTVPAAADEIATLATTMNAMLDRLARSDAAMRRFVSDASHELRSPLATLRAHIETAPQGAGGVVVDPTLTVAEVERLHRLVADLLVLARADDHGLHLRLDEVDIDDLVDHEVRRLRALAGPRVVANVVPAQVRGDAARLDQTLRNLTDNAMRHSTGWVGVEVDVADPGWVDIHVDNSGPPVPMGERLAVFDRFSRLDDARTRDGGGSGLGLAIAASFATAHGGSIRAGQTPGGDCRFTLRLPRLR